MSYKHGHLRFYLLHLLVREAEERLYARIGHIAQLKQFCRGLNSSFSPFFLQKFLDFRESFLPLRTLFFIKQMRNKALDELNA